MTYLKDKTIVLGITAGAAIGKSLELTRRLKKKGVTIYPVLTRNAAKLISPQLFSAMAGNQAQVRMFSKQADSMQHINLQKADLLCCAPATANFIGKVANGIADDLLTTTVLASPVPLVIAPAMNTVMWEKPVVQENLSKINATICGPATGELACSAVGCGRMADITEILAYCERVLAPNDLDGKKFLITAGPTREAWDDVRFLSNRSSGRMGYSLAKEAWLRGATVTLVSGPVALENPYGMEIIMVESAEEMFEAVCERFPESDVFVSAAAVSDFKFEKVSGKIKKDQLPSMRFERNPDILKWCSENRKHQKIIGFALEDADLESRAHRKLEEKRCDLLVGNLLSNLGVSEGECLVFGRDDPKRFTGKKSDLARGILEALL